MMVYFMLDGLKEHRLIFSYRVQVQKKLASIEGSKSCRGKVHISCISQVHYKFMLKLNSISI